MQQGCLKALNTSKSLHLHNTQSCSICQGIQIICTRLLPIYLCSVLISGITPDTCVLFFELSWNWPHLRTLTELWGSAKLLAGVRHVHGMIGSAPQQLWCCGIPRTSLHTSHSPTCCRTRAEYHKKSWVEIDGFFFFSECMVNVK